MTSKINGINNIGNISNISGLNIDSKISKANKANISNAGNAVNVVNKVNTVILALDLGTTTGFAMLDSSDHISSGSVSFKASKFEGGGMPYLRFKRWLTEMKEGCGYSPCCNHIDAIYFEEVRRHIGTDAAHKYGGLWLIYAHGPSITKYRIRG